MILWSIIYNWSYSDKKLRPRELKHWSQWNDIAECKTQFQVPEHILFLCYSFLGRVEIMATGEQHYCKFENRRMSVGEETLNVIM